MSIGSIVAQNHIATPQNTATQGVNEVPAALQGAHSSRAKIAGRIVAGFLTAGLSEPIIAMARGVKNAIVKHARVKEAHAQKLAKARADSNNYDLANHIKFEHKLPAPQTAAIREGLETVQQDFDNKGLHSTTKLSNNALKNVEKAIRNSKNEVTPERLKELVAKQVRSEAASNMFGTLVQAFMSSKNLSALPMKDIDMLKNPDLHDLKKGLEGCQNAGDVQALYNQFKEPLENTLKFQNTAYQVRNEMRTEAHAALAERTGLSLENIQTSQTNQTLNTAILPIYEQMASQTPLPDAAQIKTAFTNAFATQQAAQDAILETIQDLPISPALKQQFSIEICCNTKHADNPEVFAKAAEILKNIDTASISNAMQLPKGAIHEDEFNHLFKVLGNDLQKNFATTYGDSLKQLSKNSVETAKNVIARMLFDQHPAISKAFKAAPNVLNQIQKELISHRQLSTYGMQTMSRSENLANDFVYNLELAHDDIQATNTKLLEQLSKPKPIQTPLLMQHKDACLTALRDIRASFGANSIPAGNTVEELNTSPAGRSIVKALASAIKDADEPITPQETQKLAHNILHDIAQTTAKQNTLRDLMQGASNGLPVSLSAIGAFRSTLEARHPELKEKLDTASSVAEMQEALHALPDLQACLEFTVATEVKSISTPVYNKLKADLAKALNLDIKAIEYSFIPKEYLNDVVVEVKNNAIKDMRQPGANIPDPAQLTAKIAPEGDAVFNEKINLIQSLPTLRAFQGNPLSPASQKQLQTFLLQVRSISMPEDLQVFTNITARLNIEESIAALRSGDKDSAMSALRTLSQSIYDTAHDVIPEDVYHDMGPDQLNDIGKVVPIMLIGSAPEFHEAIHSNKDFLLEVKQELNEEYSLISPHIGSAGSGQFKALVAASSNITQTVSFIDAALNA